MTKLPKDLNSKGAISTILGTILILSIALATANLLKTYKQINLQRQGSLWTVIQLDKEMDNTLFDAQQYINGYVQEKSLRTSYEVLWSRFPVTISNLKKDEFLIEITGLSKLVNDVFDHVKFAESMILESKPIDKAELNRWTNKLNVMARDINQQFLQNIVPTHSQYTTKAASKIITNAAILLVLISAFILYLGYLLVTLRKERSRNLHMLAHDTLTGLYSRDFTMKAIDSSCDNKHPFTLLAFDLNKFKAVNDTFGHHAGDQLLIHLAEKFRNTLSKFGIVGRTGGDEFLWVAESADVRIIEQQYVLFLNELEDPCIIAGKPIYLHISTGGGVAADYDFHSTQLLERVDQAMYQAKSKQIKEIVWENQTRVPTAAKPNEGKPKVIAKRASRSEELEYP